MKKVPLTNVRMFIEGSAKEKKEFVNLFGSSLQEFGFVVIEGHGIETQLIRESYKKVEELFALPLEQKLKYTDPTGLGQRGYVSFGLEHAKDYDKGDLKEFWHVGREFFADKALEQKYDPNIWPTDTLPGFKKPLLELYSALDAFAAVLLRATSIYLGLEEHTLPRMAQDGNTILRALHYPPLTDDQFKSGAVRSAAHEDINLITILCEATQGGLELLTREGKWLAIECAEGQMVVDSGDMLSRVTNEVIPATTHRVVNPLNAKNVSRYSMPFFVHAYADCDLKIFDNCVTPTRPALYPPILAKEFLVQRLKEIGLGKK